MENEKKKTFGKLSIISMRGCEEITSKIDMYLKQFRADYEDVDTYITHITCPRFGTGEAKCVIDETVRGHDLFIICDMFNHGVTYKMYESENHMSPDDHYQDLKRIIAAASGKARRITVVMPCSTRADSTEEQQENRSTALWLCRSLPEWV